jgi:cytochrome c oxidase subunit III
MTTETLEEKAHRIANERFGSGGGIPGTGGSRPRQPSGDGETDDPPAFIPDKSRILTGFLILVVVMTFGGLLAAYIVIATNNVAEWKPFSLPIQVWISSVLILVSSLTYHIGQRAVSTGRLDPAKAWMIGTTVLAAAFISSQLLSWIELSRLGLFIAGNPYTGFFYILTGVHAVHVIGGIVALGAVMLQIWYPTGTDEGRVRRQTLSEVVGWYWHTMGVLWLTIFVLLGFWK